MVVWLSASWPQMTLFVPPPSTPEVSETGNRISLQMKHWPDFFNDAAINPLECKAF